MEPGFTKADTNSLPKVDFYMVQYFLTTNEKFRDANKKGKIERSSNPDYLKSAIGRVQLKIDGSLCTVKAKIVPEHKITARQYSVVAIINTVEEKVVDIFCENDTQGCKAAAGGCKHAIAFLFYLYEKYNQPSPTDSTCLWKVPNLSKVEENIEKFNLEKYRDSGVSNTNQIVNGSNRFLQTLIEKCVHSGPISSLKYHQTFPKEEGYGLHCLLIDFKETLEAKQSSKRFIQYCKHTMVDSVCKKIETITLGQECSLWKLLKYGRITASKIFDLSRCQTGDGSLVRSVLGQSSFTSEAMKRGLQLEAKVVRVIRTRYRNVRRCGLFLNPHYPAFGASPDAINSSTVFEIKCPSKNENVKYYIDENANLKDRVKSQIHLQMVMSNRSKGVLVLVLPEFEKSRNPLQFVEFHDIDLDIDYIEQKMSDSYKFWKTNIFNKLYATF
ncbi:uncharacterized protein LOC128741160 [Sabethes cyaneus]|uniref:uncharacterized protein LOC128741160 n=1 Tax=Sabethes cyaneus TaxID=53552 RepID=UPI00237E500A|nr:uncharacterized protein LOC128741160 [Sabethes cyaneus]